MYAFHHSPIKLVRPGRLARPRADQGAAVFKTARSTLPRTAANGRGGRIRTGTGNYAQRVLSPPCLRSNHAAINWCGQRESHPHEPIAHRLLGPVRLLFRHVRIKWSIHRDVRPARCLTKAVRRYLRVGCMKWSKRKDSHLRSPGGRRVYSALRLLLCHASKNGGSSGIRTRGLLLMRELR